MAPMPIAVISPEIIVILRTLATIAAAAGSSGFSSSSRIELMAEYQAQREELVADQDAGGRLDRLLAGRLADLSRTRLKALILDGKVTVDGRTILDPGLRVNSGQRI